jgi:streptomycin 6-kinase
MTKKLTNLHATTEAEDEMEGGLLLDVVIGKGAAILKLLAGENQALLIRRDALLILNLRLDVVDSIRGLNLEGDGLARH